jgi:copper chaperone
MKIAIEGMHCQGCVERLRKSLERVETARVEHIEVGSAEVAVEPGRESALLDAVRKAGFEPRTSE